MYKIIYNNLVIDVVKKLRYVKYIPEFKKVLPVSAIDAHGICGSDNKTFYALFNVKIPEEKSYWKKVTFIKIDEAEYLDLQDKLHKKYVYSHQIKLKKSQK